MLSKRGYSNPFCCDYVCQSSSSGRHSQRQHRLPIYGSQRSVIWWAGGGKKDIWWSESGGKLTTEGFYCGLFKLCLIQMTAQCLVKPLKMMWSTDRDTWALRQEWDMSVEAAAYVHANQSLYLFHLYKFSYLGLEIYWPAVVSLSSARSERHTHACWRDFKGSTALFLAPAFNHFSRSP